MRNLNIVSFFLTVGASCLLLVVPSYSGLTETRSATGVISVTTHHATLLEVNGRRALIPLLIPVLIVVMPLIFRSRWVCIGATVVLTFFVVIASFSISLFYLPSAGTLFVASVLSLARKR